MTSEFQKEDEKKLNEKTSENESNIDSLKTFEEIAMYCASTVMIHVFNKNGDEIAFGSGIVISEDGMIATNYHVIADGYIFKVVFENEQEMITHIVLSAKPSVDLAIIKINHTTTTPIPFSNDGNVKRGQTVVALGSPMGLLNTISNGIVSGIRNFGSTNLIQTTTPISSGSSGGALLNMHGHLIGVISSSFSKGQNLNMAVHVSCLQELRNHTLTTLNRTVLEKFSTIYFEDILTYQMDVFFEYNLEKPYYIMLTFKPKDYQDIEDLKENKNLKKAIENFCKEQLIRIPVSFGIEKFQGGIGYNKYGLSFLYDQGEFYDFKWE